MYRCGQEFFPGASFAQQEDGRVGRGDLLHLSEHAPNGLALPHSPMMPAVESHLVAETDVFVTEPALEALHFCQGLAQGILRFLQQRVGVLRLGGTPR